MKKYFTKWIPQKGEMKIEYFCDDPQCSIPNRCFYQGKPTLCSQKSRQVPITKFCLCSKDIDVKSIKPMQDIFYDDKGMSHRVTQNWIDNRGKFNHLWFKVIGEISPKAKWVKEGMEFDSSEVANRNDEGWICELSFSELESPEAGQDLRDKGIWKIAIKGPCGHFH